MISLISSLAGRGAKMLNKIYKNVENGNFYREGKNQKTVYFRLPSGVWAVATRWRPADLAHYPFIGVNSTNC